MTEFNKKHSLETARFVAVILRAMLKDTAEIEKILTDNTVNDTELKLAIYNLILSYHDLKPELEWLNSFRRQ